MSDYQVMFGFLCMSGAAVVLSITVAFFRLSLRVMRLEMLGDDLLKMAKDKEEKGGK